MTGLKIGEIRGSVTVVEGHVFNISNPSPELMERLGAVKGVSTEVKPGQGGLDSAGAQRIESLERNVNEILRHVRDAEQKGEHIESVQVGTVQLSRVELILKQAVLVKSEADQMYFDQLEKNKHLIEQAKQQSDAGNRFQLDLAGVMEGFDGRAHREKLNRAYQMLREAQTLEPTNAEVLLHMARIMSELEVGELEVRKVLYTVQNLLSPPRDDTDKFHLAQATFMMATMGEHQHNDALRSARDMFAEIGRTDWVVHCDSFLATSQASQSTPPTAFQQQVPQPAVFNPAGNWHAQMSNGGTMTLQLFPNGAMQGTQRVGMFGLSVNFAGQWGFNPYNGMLQLQGLVAGFTPFFLQIVIQGHSGGGFIGMGSDSLQYVLRPA
ncbi:MAG TPA: hypothetical protein VG778_04305 [Blastocatellia bacterium]|nr:hypothetical protein [Blastocatellia bacterium]